MGLAIKESVLLFLSIFSPKIYALQAVLYFCQGTRILGLTMDTLSLFYIADFHTLESQWTEYQYKSISY